MAPALVVTISGVRYNPASMRLLRSWQAIAPTLLRVSGCERCVLLPGLPALSRVASICEERSNATGSDQSRCHAAWSTCPGLLAFYLSGHFFRCVFVEQFVVLGLQDRGGTVGCLCADVAARDFMRILVLGIFAAAAACPFL